MMESSTVRLNKDVSPIKGSKRGPNILFIVTKNVLNMANNAFCGVWSESTLFVNAPFLEFLVYMH